jgi:hypothetical protein
VPGIIISPLAKTNYVDHNYYETLSILKTVEQRYGLAPLTSADASANGFGSTFNTSIPIAVQPPAPPRLSISSSGDSITLSWPVDSTGYLLQSATSLTGPWTEISTGGTNTVTVTIDPGHPSLFWRLLRP